MRRLALLPLLLLPLRALPARAQSNAELMANDHYTRSHDYDLVHQRIVGSDFDGASTSFGGRVTTPLVARRPGMDWVVLDGGALPRNPAVTDKQGTARRSERQGDTLGVFPAATLG